jgi:hypothetical protein
MDEHRYQVATGNRKLVLENGRDVLNSSDEDHEEVLKGMYQGGLKAPVVLSQEEVARQRAFASYAKSVGYGAWIESGSNHPSEDSGFSDSTPSRSQSPTPPASSTGGSEFKTSGPADSSKPVRSTLNPFVPRSSTPIESAPPHPVTPTKAPPRPSTPVSVPLILRPRSVPERRRELVRRRPPGLQTPTFPTQWPPVVERAELEACEMWAAQGKRIRVLQIATLLRPES